MNNHNSNNNLAFLGGLGLLWYLSENERCNHGYTKREGCHECAQAYVYQKNMIYTTGLVRASIGAFFTFLLSTIGILIMAGIVGGVVWFILALLFNAHLGIANASFFVVLIISLFYIGAEAKTQIKCVLKRNKIYYTDNGSRYLLPEAKNVGLFSKKYVGQYPTVYFLK